MSKLIAIGSVSQVEALCEEHGCEEGLLEDAKNDKGKLTKASVKARLTAIKHDSESDEERKLLNEFLDLLDQEAAASEETKGCSKDRWKLMLMLNTTHFQNPRLKI